MASKRSLSIGGSHRLAGRSISKRSKLHTKVHEPLLNSVVTAGTPVNNKLRQCYRLGRDLCDNDVRLLVSPYRVVFVDNFFSDPGFVDALENDLLKLDLTQKNNDLYKFCQSKDLLNVNNGFPGLHAVTNLFKKKVQPWLRKLTGIDLHQNEISMSYSRYGYTDVLLCHDDELEGRRIAYIFYLVSPSWSCEDGGALELFEIDAVTREPTKVVRSIMPLRNRLLFFEVTPATFHQVAEVISEDKYRHSLVGWFNGAPLEYPARHAELPLPLLPSGFIKESLLRAWVNPLYLSEETEKEVQLRFADEGQIQLNSFLNEDRYSAASAAFAAFDNWCEVGPPNRRRVFELPLSAQRHGNGAIPNVLRELFALFRSEAMFLILSNMTGLPLHHLSITGQEGGGNNEPAPDPKCRMKVRDWRHRTYALVHDDFQDNLQSVLDTSIYFNVTSQWEETYGGFTTYIDGNEELLTVLPQSNSLSVVYREEGVLRFVKYINHQVQKLKMPKLNHFQEVYVKYTY